MTSLDSNLLIYAYDTDCPFHEQAFAFLSSIQNSSDVILSEFSLIEFYRLLRNSSVISEPLSAADAVAVIQSYRQHPSWKTVGFPTESERVHEELWAAAAQRNFAFRRIFDARLALVLRQFGVTKFATANVKDFEGFGFRRVWNPLTEMQK